MTETKSRDGVILKNGDKAWYNTDEGFAEVIIGQRCSWSTFIAETQYAWASKQAAENWKSGKHLTEEQKDFFRETFGAEFE